MASNHARAKALFSEAYDLSAGEREAWLRRECADDEPLFREVWSLLEVEADERGRSFLDVPAAAPVSELLDVLPLPRGNEVPERIGPYILEREIGRNMGVVYLAVDERLGRRVALKSIPPEYAGDEKRRDRLRFEARAAASLVHPGIATVFALEEIDGRLYISSKYVEGCTLRSEIERGPIPPERLVSIALGVARALAAAHAKDIIHRDLKPENVMVTPAGDVKIIDFGIACIARGEADGGSRKTAPGMIAGTPGYLAPEQIDGQPADARSDIFAFGVLCYEAASGMNPFEGSTSSATVARILGHHPPPLPKVNPIVPDALDRVVRKCIEKVPENRYQSTEALLADLAQVASPTPPVRVEPVVTPVPPPMDYRAVWRVHQVAVMLVYGALVYPAWMAAKAAGAPWLSAVFFVLLAAAIFNGTLRVHLLFTDAFNPRGIPDRVHGVRPWLLSADLAFAALLLAIAVPIAEGSIVLAAFLGGVGVAAGATALLVEPSTAFYAFGRPRASGAARRTPPAGTRRTPPAGTRRTPPGGARADSSGAR